MKVSLEWNFHTAWNNLARLAKKQGMKVLIEWNFHTARDNSTQDIKQFHSTQKFNYCIMRKVERVERLQKPLMRMKPPYLFACKGDCQRNLPLHVMLWAQSEGNIRLSWKAAEASHAHEITIFVQLHEWFTKELTASCTTLGAKWRQHPFELKGCRSLSCVWNLHICSAACMIFKGTYSFKWCTRLKMKATSV